MSSRQGAPRRSGMDGGTPEGRESGLVYARASRRMPGGVNSPVRSFRAVGGTPVAVREGRGCRLVDAEGREYVDLVMGWGSLILGHSHPGVREALDKALSRGWNFGALTADECELAEFLCEAVPGMEMVRLVNSGTEAAISAVRLARAHTGRDKVVKCDECYHGHSDGLLAERVTDDFTSRPSSLGVPASYAGETLCVPYNDIDALGRAFQMHGEGIAAVILEPVAGNKGVIVPEEGFLAGAREICDRWGSLLVFDEVITGFRFALGTCGELLGIRPDIICMGKIIGGGLPVGAYGATREIMEKVAPLGGMYQAGTFSGNLASVTAGLATLRALEAENPYPRLESLGAMLQEGLEKAAAAEGISLAVERFGSMVSARFTPLDGQGEEESAELYSRFFHHMLARGIYLPPSPTEAWFLSSAHGEEDVGRILEAAAEALRAMAGAG